MSFLVEEYIGQQTVQENDKLDYGTPRHSGRYPWGSGKNPQRSRNWLKRVDDLKKQGLSDKEICKAFNMSSGDFIAWKRVYKEQEDMKARFKVQKLHDKQWSNVAIAKELTEKGYDITEGTVRKWLKEGPDYKGMPIKNISDSLKTILKDKPYLDIGEGVERQLNISAEQLYAARLMLESEGYNVYDYKLPQATNPKQRTSMVVLCGPETTKENFKANIGKITSPDGIYFEDYGMTTKTVKPIPSINSDRIQINYAETGGSNMDGLIEIRPGVEDLALGGRHYAQVRIGVDGTHYIKGVACYGDPEKMPDGVDIVFNVSKHEGTPMLGEGDNTVLKPMKSDPTNPFGASFRQWEYTDSEGNSQISPINIVNDDSDWDTWKHNSSAQFLSKQPVAIAKQQLDKRYSEFEREFEEIQNITNPTLKKQLLNEFADKCESATVDLQAAAFPRQNTFAILPVLSLKDNEVYAPQYENGEDIILIRHPHEGVFQIPRLTVNNNNQEAIDRLGLAPQHAIGITPSTAAQMSGADYDGDTVIAIPVTLFKRSDGTSEDIPFHTEKAIKELIEFNPTETYHRLPGDKECTGQDRDGLKGDKFNKGLEMGKISNLITDMTLKGAAKAEDSGDGKGAVAGEEIIRAVKFSMTVIDAEKHNLDWKRAYYELNIPELVEKYQLKENGDSGGASTLISMSRSPIRVPERKEKTSTYNMTPEELERYNRGEKIYYDTDRQHKDSKRIYDTNKMTPEELELYNKGKKVYRDTGKIKDAQTEISKMEWALDYAGDANAIAAGGTIMEKTYGDHANRLRALANEARMAERTAGNMQVNKSAKIVYAEELESLNNKVLKAQMEAPKERQAQAIAYSNVQAKLEADPSLNDKDNAGKLKKLRNKALENARDLVNGGVHKKRYRVTFTDREIEAIQAGAISEAKMKTLIRYADKNELKKAFLPKRSTGMTASDVSKARRLLANGANIGEVASQLGISTSTLYKEIPDANELNDKKKG